MNREIKFRGKKISNGEWVYGYYITDLMSHYICYFKGYSTIYHEVIPESVGEFTGLKDKNGKGSCIYENDFVDLQGNIKGNLYENPEMVKDATYLLIQGFGTKDWITTYKEAVGRGCNDAK